MAVFIMLFLLGTDSWQVNFRIILAERLILKQAKGKQSIENMVGLTLGN